MIYINEFDPHAAAWLRELSNNGDLPHAHIDSRSILEVQASDLADFTQCHFFGGIAGWPLALKLAGWPVDRPVWTASLPCQPWSCAGKGLGAGDDRHLLPHFAELVRECLPPIILGEQVASKAARTEWLPGVYLEFEKMGYSVACVDLCAPCAGEVGEGWIVRGGEGRWENIIIGGPHIRQRLYWVAVLDRMGDPAGVRRCGGKENRGGEQSEVSRAGSDRNVSDGLANANSGRCKQRHQGEWAIPVAITGGAACRLANMQQQGLEGFAGDERDGNEPGRVGAQPSGYAAEGGAACELGDPPRGGRGERGDAPRAGSGGHADGAECVGGLGHAKGDGRQDGSRIHGEHDGAQLEHGCGDNVAVGGVADHNGSDKFGVCGSSGEGVPEGHEWGRGIVQANGRVPSGSWSDFDILPCRDGKARRTGSGIFPLVQSARGAKPCAVSVADGLPGGVVPGGDPRLPKYANETAEGRVMRLRGYGNAIVPPLASMFIECVMETLYQ